MNVDPKAPIEELFKTFGLDIHSEHLDTKYPMNALAALISRLGAISSACSSLINHSDEGQHVQIELKRRLRLALIQLAALALAYAQMLNHVPEKEDAPAALDWRALEEEYGQHG